jgi:hypothetical protein
MRGSARLGAATVLTGGGTGKGAGGGAFSCRLVVGILGISCGKRKRMYKIYGIPYHDVPAVLRIRIRDPVPFDPWIRDPE